MKMKLTWSQYCDQFRPTIIQADNILHRAGLPLAPQDWTPQDVVRAERILRRITERRAKAVADRAVQ